MTVTGDKVNLLTVQLIPSPVYPILQLHILVPPIMLIHCALAEHPPLLVEHALMPSMRTTTYVKFDVPYHLHNVMPG